MIELEDHWIRLIAVHARVCAQKRQDEVLRFSYPPSLQGVVPPAMMSMALCVVRLEAVAAPPLPPRA
jgi:hypothetical protein